MNSPVSARFASALPGKILLAVDQSVASQHAVAYASHIVAAGGIIRLVSIVENPRTLVPAGSLVRSALQAARDELLRDAHEALARAADVLAGHGIQVEKEAIDLAARGGDVVHALIDAADAWQPDLIVTGAHQHHGLLRWVEGAVSAPLARLSPCPILIVPATGNADAYALPRHILFAVDGSDQATQALRYGVRFSTPDTSLRAIYVVDRAVRLSDLVPIDVLEDAFVDEGTRALAAAGPLLRVASGRSNVELVRTERTGDDVAHAIVREAASWQANMIVMGTHGRRGMVRWMLGSVAERVAHITPVPLLLVHGRHT
ncbi:universal stress protein [Paraburkholderia sp. ZP32-5]|uniref:universal stress protein n=1 Tax=Paraburkholderia sp. ZP32-5 TaxID=2883245 RepID=UPI001F1D770B|nr:universal stress protein [Paraburkholderia sp. ZP32-5]